MSPESCHFSYFPFSFRCIYFFVSLLIFILIFCYTRNMVCINTGPLWVYSVAQLVQALRYKPEGRGFDYRWCHWNFSIDIILPAALWH